MTMTPVYSLTIPGNPTIQISQDELRSLLGEIEAQLHRSQVYRRALAAMQNMLGDSAEQAKILFKAVSREAIGLAFHQFALQHEKTPAVPDVSPTVAQEMSHDLANCLTVVKSHPKANEENLPDKSQINPANSKDKQKTKTPIRWLNNQKRVAKAELAKKMAAERRLESLRKIGEQLKFARQSQNLSLQQLHVFTKVPIHQMEAIENANLELLPDDVYLRGFIRLMANALALNGTTLAASLFAPDTVKSVSPSWHQSKKGTGGFGFEIRPVHLYVGYTALVAGAVGGLSLMQQADSDKALNPEIIIPPSSSLSHSSEKVSVTVTPNLKSAVGIHISPPEAL